MEWGKSGEKKENDYDPKHTSSFVKHGDIGSVTAVQLYRLSL